MKLPVSQKHIPVLSTVFVCVLLYVAACVRYDGFFSLRVFVNFFINNSFLGIASVGMTFVILSGGIDLSVGSMMALCSVVVARLVMDLHVPPPVAIALALAIGSLLGCAMGCIIRWAGLAPFIVTLAGLFFARGAALVLCDGSVRIDHGFYDAVAGWRLPLGPAGVPLHALLFVAVVAVGIYVLACRPFGRSVYAVGGNEEGALLMGVPVGRTKVLVYTLSGFCSALAGVVFTLDSVSGNARAGVGMELDAIAAVVVGGTLLSGGVGYVFGTLVGVLIFAIIQTAIAFQGDLNEYWARVAIGVLLLFFILLQKLCARPGLRRE